MWAGLRFLALDFFIVFNISKDQYNSWRHPISPCTRFRRQRPFLVMIPLLLERVVPVKFPVWDAKVSVFFYM